MNRKKQKLKPDVVLKNYWNGNAEFADLFNTVLFQGKQIMLAPVITVVVYYGKDEWDGAKSLHEMLELSDEWADYVNDYKMLLVEARKSNLVFHNMNNRHLFGLLEILLEQGQNANEVKNIAIAYADGNEIETCVAMAAAGAAKCNIDYQMLSKKEGVNMGTVFEELAKENKELGKAEGIITTCMELKVSKDDIIQKLKEKLNVSEKQAQEYYMTFAK